jgi:hypothetical protein
MVAIKGGDKLQRALAELTTKLTKYGTLRVGFLENATYPSGLKVALVATLNEYGVPSRNQPPRPFFRSLINSKEKEWGPAIAKLLKSTNYDVDQTLMLTGEAIKGQLQTSIRNFVGAPLSPRTIARKGHDKQLIDTGHMLSSVDFEVKIK